MYFPAPGGRKKKIFESDLLCEIIRCGHFDKIDFIELFGCEDYLGEKMTALF